ncbi:hypothetical protein EDB89DRAFT_1987964 [Lactarius sanguifluus]|nr:hypothetical protein EDB89DRAFT_1987964 [Lactarius sanguifluus]
MVRVAGREECVIYSFRASNLTSYLAPKRQIVGCACRHQRRRRQVIKCGGMTLPWTAAQFDPEIENTPNLEERAHFFSWALGSRNVHGPDDSPEALYPRCAHAAERWACLSHSLVAFHRLVLRENPGHAFIDLLKIDVEGAEFDTLTAFLAAHKPLSPFSSTMLLIGQL